jgi:O-antigen biosynthesis protein WbqV
MAFYVKAFYSLTMMKPLLPNWRILIVMMHDAVATGAALLLSLALRFDIATLTARTEFLQRFLPAFVLYAAGVYSLFQLYRSKWRFASLPDLVNIFRSASVLALSLLALDYIFASSAFVNTLVFGKITLFLYWVLQMFALGGPRILYRYVRYLHSRKGGSARGKASALLVGDAADADVILRAIESGTVRDIRVLGLLSPAKGDQGQSIRLVRVLGRPSDIESVLIDFEQNQQRLHRIILLSSVILDADASHILGIAKQFSIPVSRFAPLADRARVDQGLELKSIDVEDLLFRESAKINLARLRELIAGRKIIVTGGAGSIGAEICTRVVELGAKNLMVLDHAEAALFGVMQKIEAIKGATQITARLADVRNAASINRLFKEFNPDLVFHAAALKHVPMIERDWAEGLATNIFGAVNVCHAAIDAKARGVVIISTDKAVEPVSMLGLSKRFGEFYAAALDQENRNNPRLISVRFGNVLASSGSVVPIFKAQIASGGPVTVTHQGMVRYFMTAREACDLVLTSASHANFDHARSSSVYVLDMGQPVRILDLAERMIRLSGLEPYRDVKIEFSGMRPGERLQEALFAQNEKLQEIDIEGISAALGRGPSLQTLDEALQELEKMLDKQDRNGALSLLQGIIAGKSASPKLAMIRSAS